MEDGNDSLSQIFFMMKYQTGTDTSQPQNENNLINLSSFMVLIDPNNITAIFSVMNLPY
jgi:hypothetical protein